MANVATCMCKACVKWRKSHGLADPAQVAPAVALDELLAAAEETARALRIIGDRQLEPGLIPIAAYLEAAIAKFRGAK